MTLFRALLPTALSSLIIALIVGTALIVIRNNGRTGISTMAVKARVGLSGVFLLFNGTALEAAGGGTFISYRNNVLFGNTQDGASVEAGIHKRP